jgi:CRP/FNR family transcriptional regulator
MTGADQGLHKVELGCSNCAIRSRAVCGVLSDSELVLLNEMSWHKTYPAGATIFVEDDDPVFFGNVVSGVIKLSKMLADGRQQIVGLLFPSDFLGRAYAERSQMFAEAATEVELCCFPRDRFQALLQQKPGLEHRLFERTLDELDSAREWMVLLGRKTAGERVASFLHMVARRSQNHGCAHTPEPAELRIQLPLTRADIADYLGLTIETVSRHITRMKTAGLIRLLSNREILVPNIDRLGAAAGWDQE